MAFGIHHCATSEDVADLVADTFLAAFRAAGRYRAETATAAPWLLGIATRLASNQHRRLTRWLRVSRRAAGEPPRFTGEEYEAVEAAIDAGRQTPHVQALLRAMPAGDRKVLELVAYAQLSPTEAALALGISPQRRPPPPGPRPQAAPRAAVHRSSGRPGRPRHGGVVP
jgi:RNA polymerase sigma factor (sigma-70 family)